MIVKDNNEITVKVISSKEKLITDLEQKGFSSGRTFSLDDYYFMPNELNIKEISTREIISKCIIIRNIFDDNVYKKKITYKIKKFNNDGDILNQKAINCDIYDIEQAKLLLESIGYHQIMNQSRDLSPNASGGLTPFCPPSELQEIPVATREQSGVLCFHSR